MRQDTADIAQHDAFLWVGDPRTGTWYFVIDAPGADGKRRQVKRHGARGDDGFEPFKTKRAAQGALDAMRDELSAGRVPTPANDSVNAFAHV